MLYVIAKLDSHATEKLRTLQKAAASYGVVPSALYGHITIAAYTSDNDMDFVIGCKELLQGVSPFSVLFDKVEVLSETSIIVAAPQKSRILLTLHTRIAERYGLLLDQWTCSNNWYPHTTLLYNPQADLPRICRAVQEDFFPFEAGVKSIEFSRVTETGYEIVDRITL